MCQYLYYNYNTTGKTHYLHLLQYKEAEFTEKTKCTKPAPIQDKQEILFTIMYSLLHVSYNIHESDEDNSCIKKDNISASSLYCLYLPFLPA